jgi:hypothetical protein
MGLFDQAYDFQFLRSRIPHSSPSPTAIMPFFEQPQFQSLLGDDFLQRCRRSLTSLLVGARAVSPASLRLPASRNSFDQL